MGSGCVLELMSNIYKSSTANLSLFQNMEVGTQRDGQLDFEVIVRGRERCWQGTATFVFSHIE